MLLRTLLCLTIGLGPGCDDGPELVELHGVHVSVPPGWTARTVYDGPKYVLTMNPPRGDAACQIVVIRDGRYFREDDARALLGDGRAVFGGSPAGDAEISTPDGELTGFVHLDPEVQPSWNVRAPSGSSRVEMIAAARGVRLVAAVIVTWDDSPSAGADRARCIEALRAMR